MNILVTGGAGYIGSHTVRLLVRSGFRVVVLDNLYSGHRWAVDASATFIEGDVGDDQHVRCLLREHQINSVIHIAGHIEVEESIRDPLKYYKNNTANSLTLLRACQDLGVKKFIFSSTAAVYGSPTRLPVKEGDSLSPINPYGQSKLMTERMIQDLAGGGMRFVILRYFNVAGGAADGSLGQATPRATHLIKVAAETALSLRDHIQIYGTDFETPDGTCVRDFIHVDDLGRAHLKALQYLVEGGESDIFNCGYGAGFSVRDVIASMRRISGVEFPVVESTRRLGDPPALIADSRRIRDRIGWMPEYADLDYICRTAYEWERSHMQRKAPCMDLGLE